MVAVLDRAAVDNVGLLLDLDRYLAALQAAGYSGYVAAEYIPTTTTTESLGWFRHPEGDRP